MIYLGKLCFCIFMMYSDIDLIHTKACDKSR